MPQDSIFFDRRMLLAGLGAGAVGAAAAAASPALGLRAARDSRVRPASWWDRSFHSLNAAGMDEWSRAVGERFAVETQNGSHMLQVAAVTAFAGSGARPAGLGRSQAFSVVFETVAGRPPPATDRLYRLVHRSYPALPVYMGAPFSHGPKTRLIAVFN